MKSATGRLSFSTTWTNLPDRYPINWIIIRFVLYLFGQPLNPIVLNMAESDMDSARGASGVVCVVKTALLMCFIFFPLLVFGQEQKARTWKRFDSILKEKVHSIW